ncbi:MAG: HD domain-containing protein [Candidatus Paceibacterota bacterium]|jgi:poly(A) polymerase/tRNA nucleotidyltransferase (CCA-adding enzyme)
MNNKTLKTGYDWKIPEIVLETIKTIQNGGFEACLVGGCVRDVILGLEPKDWDVTTNAIPEQIQALFPHSFYENDYGTVGVVNELLDENGNNVIHETLRVIEVTPYRLESKYSDFRHPDCVIFSEKIEDDLKRRDLTINAIAYDPIKGQLIDPYKGQEDIKDKIVRAVGNPFDRFNEDALRMLRAIRLAADLGFTINKETMDAISESSKLLEKISRERIRDEFSKMVTSKNPMMAIVFCNKLGLLKDIAPEIEEGLHVKQNGDHIYDVWEHNLRALNHAADRGWPLHVKLAALLHDVGKPRTARWSNEKNDWTFYGHDVVGGRMTKELLTRLKYPKDIIEKVTKLVRYHLFFSDIEKITLSAVRRIVRNVGPENVWDLMSVRACDRIGMGRPKETPYRLRKYHSMIEEAMRAPVSVGMLKIDGAQIMEKTKMAPGPKVGYILHALLEEALDNPELNTDEYLSKRALELSVLSDEELKKMGEKGKEKKEEEEAKELGEIRKRYGVK